ncbi:uncharacterized protein T551_01716 [Pneumocystis jirovecii RU7]|uniref:Centromere protein H C-terminal domain-containing protein n=1 Tax=Pneumocystis jirovecii (strain RU7) TaxID=1408657 RepID=A0A0W4ZPY4_PNEJ7|nr:uncharacterized protein T551_01716 [Pneumocystis jirovecii RU7]KTW30433.1 hypothetical protein T551_01716 [Pneumocystis jirovecii RU7]
MFDEDLLIKNRLLIEERPLKKVLKRCSSIIEHHYNATHEFQESLNNQINIDFTYFELTIKRLASLWKTNKLEIFNYSNEKLELDKMILSTKTNIYQLYDKLYQAQKIKLNKLEYNKLTNEIQSDQPKDRKTLQDLINKLHAEIHALKLEKKSYINIWHSRKSQFAETIITLQAISNNIQTEKEQEKSKGLTETEIQE